jgi:hypothetical protein
MKRSRSTSTAPTDPTLHHVKTNHGTFGTNSPRVSSIQAITRGRIKITLKNPYGSIIVYATDTSEVW